MTLEIDRDRLLAALDEQARFGATDGGGLDRLALSEADAAARDWLVDAFEAAGLEVRVDAVGNVFGRRPGTDPDAAPVLVGSHLDSQPAGGRFDGTLGVVAGLEFVRALNDAGVDTRHPVEVVDWTNEEGARFTPGLQGSGVWAGQYDLEEQLATTDADGTTLEAALERRGYDGSAPAEPTEEYEAYLELHIEQGPYLESEGADVGVVTGVVGLAWGELTFEGTANHAGATPMHLRADALHAAAETVTDVRTIANGLGERTVGTTGSLGVVPDSINVVPGEATVSWEFRDPDDEVVSEARRQVLQAAETNADLEGVDLTAADRTRVAPVEFADRVVGAVADAAADLGHEARRLPSGGVHDASHLVPVCDAGMVFAVSEGGLSHSEDEYTSPADCHSAAETFANAALELAEPR